MLHLLTLHVLSAHPVHIPNKTDKTDRMGEDMGKPLHGIKRPNHEVPTLEDSSANFHCLIPVFRISIRNFLSKSLSSRASWAYFASSMGLRASKTQSTSGITYWGSTESAKTRILRRALLRSTALPTFLVAVKPTLMADVDLN
jgi:hypothetical protein